jgi:murein DD-endopeptidase MepM/ murein hydrolase activator NlpD
MSVSLSAAVGHDAPNDADDVKAVQAALKDAAHLLLDDRVDPGPVDGFCGVGTLGAIERFQRRISLYRPDLRLDPDGYTLRRLNALLAIGDMDLTFPFDRRPDDRFPFVGHGAGMRAFAARRAGGERAHAGVDIYMPDFTPVRAVADGIVTRGPSDFYLQTDALVVDHGSFVARYGEIAPDDAPPVRQGDTVEAGQVVGRVGILTQADGSRLGVPSMMLHFEMYDKTETGALTRARGTSARSHLDYTQPFLRRRDLIDPSGFMQRAALPS